jgi:pimeloyl-ACP methyl ester carboxylesterase
MVGIGWVWFATAAGAAEITTCKDAPAAGMQSHRIEAQGFGGNAYVYETGKEHARSVVLVHGLGDIGACDFREHIPWLARSFHVIAVDLPGFAQSDKGNVAYSPASYAAFLKQVADRFVHRPFVLVGHSMGAVVSLRFAALYPKDLTRLVIVDAPGILHRYTYTGQYLTYLGLGFLQGKMADSPMGGSVGKDSFGRVTERLNDLLGRAEQLNLDPQMILSIPALRQKALQGDPTRIAGLAVAVEDMSKDIPKVQTETLVIWGKEDKLAPLRTGKLLAHVMPRAQLVVIERAGHEPMRETPDRFRDVLEPFLERGLATTAAKTREPVKRGNATCERKQGVVFEGTYDTLTLYGCRNVFIGNARVRELRVIDSSVTIEDSDIGGGEVGLYANNATIEMTNGRIDGNVAINALASRLDLAGVRVEGRRAAVQTETNPALPTASVVFSVSRVRSPHTDGEVHGYFALVSGKPL